MDIKLYYQEKGKGTPLVMIHGNGEDGNYFKNQIEYFSKINGKVALVHIMCDICSPFAGRQRG